MKHVISIQDFSVEEIIAVLDRAEKMVAIARGERQDIVEIIHKVMDEEDIDMGSLSKEMQDYVKTAKVILGHTLFSDSWLEV